MKIKYYIFTLLSIALLTGCGTSLERPEKVKNSKSDNSTINSDSETTQNSDDNTIDNQNQNDDELNLAESGLKIYRENYTEPCKPDIIEFTTSHTQEEWQNIKQSNIFKQELINKCQNETVIFQDHHIEALYAFVYKYASDSNNIY